MNENIPSSNLLHPTRRRFLQSAGLVTLGATAGLSASGLLLPTQAFAQETKPKKGGHLVLAMHSASSSDHLDPASYTMSYMYTVGFQLFNTLLEQGEDAKLAPALVETWEPANADASKWVFRLRKGVTFHSGKELTTQDVLYSLNHHRGDDSKSGGKGVLLAVEDIIANDKYEFTVTLKTGNADFPAAFVDYHMGIGADGEDFDKGNGTGAFILEDFQPGVRTLTKRNPNYWHPDRANVDSVETIAMDDTTARIAALMSGQAHVINALEPRMLSHISNRPDIEILRSPENAMYCFAMRTDSEPLRNNDLRLALKYAIDREELQSSLLVGTGTLGNDIPIPSWNQYHSKDVPQHAYDPEKAAFHLKKSGFEGTIPLSVSDNGFTGSAEAAQLYQASAAKAGINIDVERVPSDGYWEEIWLKRPFVASNWSVRPTADSMLSMLLQSDAPWNETGWKNQQFDQMLAASRIELDETRRMQIYHDMQVLIAQEGGELIPVFTDNLSATNNKVKGLASVPGGGDLCGFRLPEKVWLEE